MKSVLQFRTTLCSSMEEDTVASTAEFQNLFEKEMIDLFRLFLQLTANAEKTRIGLILARRECFAISPVAKEWALVWMRRMVVRVATHLVLGTISAPHHDISDEAGPHEFHLQGSKVHLDFLRSSIVILALPDFERLAFVICVLEQNSILDCAHLLRRSPRDVNDACERAISHVVSVEERNRQKETAESSTSFFGLCALK